MYYRKKKILWLFFNLVFFSLFAYVSNALTISDLRSDEGIIIEIKNKSLDVIKKSSTPIQIVAKQIKDDTYIANKNLPSNMIIPKETGAYIISAKDTSGNLIKNAQLKGKFTLGIRYPNYIKPDFAQNLGIFMLSKEGWIPLPSQLDISQRIVKTEDARQLGVYRLLAPSDLDLKDAIIYPNPVQFGTFGGVIKKLKFQNVPLGSTIEIYTVSGEKIKEINGIASTQIIWNGEKDNGDLVTSGLYIYKIQTAGGEKFGKIAVIR
jgi:hypothetical protein